MWESPLRVFLLSGIFHVQVKYPNIYSHTYIQFVIHNLYKNTYHSISFCPSKYGIARYNLMNFLDILTFLVKISVCWKKKNLNVQKNHSLPVSVERKVLVLRLVYLFNTINRKCSNSEVFITLVQNVKIVGKMCVM